MTAALRAELLEASRDEVEAFGPNNHDRLVEALDHVADGDEVPKRDLSDVDSPEAEAALDDLGTILLNIDYFGLDQLLGQ